MEEKYDLFILESDLVKINKGLSLKSLPKYKQLELLRSFNKLMTFLGNNLNEIATNDHYILKNSLLVYFSVCNLQMFHYLPESNASRKIKSELGVIQGLYDNFKDHPKVKELNFSKNLIL